MSDEELPTSDNPPNTDAPHDAAHDVKAAVDAIADAAPAASPKDLAPNTDSAVNGLKSIDKTILRLNKYASTNPDPNFDHWTNTS